MTRRKELLAVPMPSAATASEVYSGVARAAGVLWCARHRATPGARADVAVLVVHPSSNFLGHYALDAWADRGVDAIAMTTRYLGNDGALLLENCVLDIAAVIDYLRNVEHYERVVLIGNSGGGGLASLYQQQAEKPTITEAPDGGGPDLTAAVLPPADALVLLMAHPGRAQLLTEFLDPAIGDEQQPFERIPELDMFGGKITPPYDAEWLAAYRAAQRARNDRITRWALTMLEALRRDRPEVPDLPFVVHGTCADPRFLDLSLDPSDRAPGTLWGEAHVANFMPTTLGHMTTLRSWLSQWSASTTRGHGPTCLVDVSAPVQVIYATADQCCFPSHARELFDAVQHDSKQLVAMEGGFHYLVGQTDLVHHMAEKLISWVDKVV